MDPSILLSHFWNWFSPAEGAATRRRRCTRRTAASHRAAQPVEAVRRGEALRPGGAPRRPPLAAAAVPAVAARDGQPARVADGGPLCAEREH
jgi:hypothetical protein